MEKFGTETAPVNSNCMGIVLWIKFYFQRHSEDHCWPKEEETSKRNYLDNSPSSTHEGPSTRHHDQEAPVIQRGFSSRDREGFLLLILHGKFMLCSVLWIRDPVPFWPLDPGSGIGFFRIQDLGSRIPNPYFWDLNDNFLGKKFYNFFKLAQSFFFSTPDSDPDLNLDSNPGFESGSEMFISDPV
jgi:hypothetical protein